MNNQKILNKLDQAWTDFQEACTGLTDAQMLEPGVTGDWSVRDLLAHVSWWEEEALKHLPHILSGKRPPRYSVLYGGIDAFNALMREQKRSLSLVEVQKEAAQTHQRLVEYIKSVPEEQIVLEQRFQRRLRLDTYGHFPMHTRAIRAWRERSG
jgi:hypothetical protein